MKYKKTMKAFRVAILIAVVWPTIASAALIYNFSFDPFIDSPHLAQYDADAQLTTTEISLALRAVSSGTFFSGLEEQRIKLIGSLDNNVFTTDSLVYEQYSGRFAEGISSIDISQTFSDLLSPTLIGTANFSLGTGPIFEFNLNPNAITKITLPRFNGLDNLFFNDREIELRNESVVAVSEPPTFTLLIVVLLLICAGRGLSQCFITRQSHPTALTSTV